MARPLRPLFPGAVYHVTARGNARAPIFLDELDRHVFLRGLDETVRRHGVDVLAYCLMDNHYHLLVETPRGNASHALQLLNGAYGTRFNHRHGRSGHLFQGRYGSALVEDDAHLLASARYIVRNPVEAGLCGHPAEHRWSSYLATAGLLRPPGFLAAERLLRHFAARPAAAQRRYRTFVADGGGV